MITRRWQTARWVAGFEFPSFAPEVELVSLQHDEEYPMNEGRIASTHRGVIDVADYESQFSESQVAHSTALQSGVGPEDATYFLGPLARLHHNHLCLSPTAKQLVNQLCHDWPMTNRFYSILARAIEVVHAFEEAIDLVEDFTPPDPPVVDVRRADAEGCAATEAPRGLIYHHYGVNAAGEVTSANIIPPTSQNQRQIENDLRQLLPGILDRTEPQIADACERLIRTYDPCISCSTHFLKLNLERTTK